MVLLQSGAMPAPAVGAATEEQIAAARRRLATVLERHRDAIVRAWLSAARSPGEQLPALEHHLGALVTGLREVYRYDDWSLTQSVIDGLALRRAETGRRFDHVVQRALLAGRHAIRSSFAPAEPALCDELLLDTLHECVFRFAESYQGIQLESEDERVMARIIKSLVTALEARDPYTKGHSLSVALLSQRIVRLLDTTFPEERTYLAGLLHDVGKVGIPDDILLKPGPLSDAEWKVMQSHAEKGAEILRPIRLYPEVVSAVASHHENYDGSGYPNHAAGEDIPKLARVIRVVDSFDAMTTTRVHRPSRSSDAALDELVSHRGSHYDAEVVDALVEVVGEPETMAELGLAALQIDLGEAG